MLQIKPENNVEYLFRRLLLLLSLLLLLLLLLLLFMNTLFEILKIRIALQKICSLIYTN